MNYLGIDKVSINNGPGVRVVLWVSGCTVCCEGCQNPESWNFNAGKLFDEDAQKELYNALKKPYIKGITFSGGDPLNDYNIMDMWRLIGIIKRMHKDKNIWLYTGQVWEDIMSDNKNDIVDKIKKDILVKCDVVVDGPYIEEQRDITLKFRGSKNQRLINVQETLKQGEIITIQN